MENKITLIIKIYQCVVLTVIAIALVFLIQKTPVPFTLNTLKSGKVKPIDMPITKVMGSVDVNY